MATVAHVSDRLGWSSSVAEKRGVFDHGLFDCEFHDVFGEHVAKQTWLAEEFGA